ncbi:MAG TPA: gamma-glutamyl-phosphate reductase, partial [Aquifex aeolicus]|nr:gamma-glutamyl-phosphate reductase [Aquifex aeolicus]
MTAVNEEILSYIEEKVEKARNTLRELTSLETSVKNATLLKIAELIDKNRDYIKEENKKDVEKAKEVGLRPAVIDRLILNDKRINGMIKVL